MVSSSFLLLKTIFQPLFFFLKISEIILIHLRLVSDLESPISFTRLSNSLREFLPIVLIGIVLFLFSSAFLVSLDILCF